MSQELIGLEYLKANEIKNMTCDMDKPFAFISYSHDEYDSQIVMNVFKILYNRGINIWIDTANMPLNENDWKASAMQALMCKNCKFAFYFRSESSMIKDTIAKELETIKKLKHIGPIVTIDIWHDPNNSAGKFYDEVLNGGDYSVYAICDKICGFVNTECKALRLLSDLGNKIQDLADDMYEEAIKLVGSIQPQSKCCDVVFKNEEEIRRLTVEEGTKLEKPVTPMKNGYVFKGWFADKVSGENVEWDFENCVVDSNIELRAKWEQVTNPKPPTEENLWTYRAKGAVAYIEWDGESKDCIVKKGSKVAAESNGFAKLAPAKRMKDILLQKGVIENNEFVADYSCDKISTMINVLTGGSVSMPKAIKDGVLRKNDGKEVPDTSNDKFVYSIWGETHTSNSLADMMHDVFDFITAKYPEKVDAMAHDISITAVALKSDVDGNRLPSNKMNYFKAKKEHTVDGRSYYVSTRYNREQGIGQLKKMLELCEGNADAFVIVSEPKKSVHSGKSVDSGKKGLGELL